MKKAILSLLTGILIMGVATGCSNDESAKGDTSLMQLSTNVADTEETSNEDTTATVVEQEEEIESVFADLEAMDEADDEQYTGNPVPVVENGIKLWVPGDYWCLLEEGKGLVVYQDDIFTLLLGIRDGSLAEKMQNPAYLQEGAIDFGGEIQSDVELIEIDGKEYAYFAFTKDGERFVVAYTDAADSGKRVGAQIQVVDRNATDLDMVEYFARVASTAEVTDEPDTTKESLDEARHISNIGVEKEESTLEFDGCTVTFQVADGFYSGYTETDDYWAVEYFAEDGYERSIDCYLMSTEDWADAESYIAFEAEYSEGVVVQDTIEVNGYTFYYIERDYEDEGDSIQRVEAACDVGNGVIYRISVWASNVEKDVTVEDVMTFMSIREE